MVVGSSDEHVFMVMEYCDSDLRAAIAALDRPLSQAEVKSLMQQLISATEHLHSHWVMHRDLKTANLLYTGDGAQGFAPARGVARAHPTVPRRRSSLRVRLWHGAQVRGPHSAVFPHRGHADIPRP